MPLWGYLLNCIKGHPKKPGVESHAYTLSSYEAETVDYYPLLGLDCGLLSTVVGGGGGRERESRDRRGLGNQLVRLLTMLIEGKHKYIA